MKKTIVVLICFCFLSAKIHATGKENFQMPKDTIYLLTLVDLFEVNAGSFIYDIYKPMLYYKHELDFNGNRLIKTNPYLPNERDYISSNIKSYLGANTEIIIVKDTSCFNKLLSDSLSRRDVKDIREACNRCRFKKLLLLDVQWRYLNHNMYHLLEHPYFREHYAKRGTWFKIRVKYIDLAEGNLIYSKDFLKNKLWGDLKPGEIANKYKHARFFRKAARDFKNFLLKNQS